MMKSTMIGAAMIALAAGCVPTQMQGQAGPPLSPPAQTSITIDGKALTVKYGAPSMRGRKMFGEGGVVSKDATYPVWRAGANAATALQTEADLNIKGLAVPKGSYTVYALVNTTPWQLIISKQTGQGGHTYDQAQDLGRVPMDMSKPAAPVETHKITLSSTGAKTGKLQLEFENFIASVPFTVK